ncbi:MAG: hypothetical protein H6561_22535 [Lewinellaceae bacterium]|nr:hypothetical protein [Lewinellaceae bacterium]HPG05337.1 hypothetical protein [Saprospiraceae bacterium]HPQ98119.1 hypothetical protein [Saprospiraceae bacterium]
MRSFKWLMVVILIFAGGFISGCFKDIPAFTYLELHPAIFYLRNSEINSDQDITEYHLYGSEGFLGAFRTNAIAPIGFPSYNKNITIFPGVRENGLQLYPAFYPMLEPAIIAPSTQPGSTESIQPVFTYKDGVKFRWLEPFRDQLSLDLDLDQDSFTHLRILPGIGIGGTGAGTANLTKAHPVIEVTTSAALTQLPKDGTPIWMEMHYKGDVLLQIGLRGVAPGLNPVINYKLALFPKADWNKIYINFTPDVQLSDLTEYQVVFRAELPDTLSEGSVYLDNIKLLHL